MHRIDTEGSINNKFSEGNPGLGIEGTKVSADWLNDIQESIAYVIEAAGLSLEKGNPALLANAILSAIASGSFEQLDTRITQLNSSYLYGARNVFRQPNMPIESEQGPFFDNDIWIDTSQFPEKVYIWNSVTKTWVDTTNDRAARGILALQKAQAIADGFIDIFLSETEPENPSEGDIWYNQRTDELFVYDAGIWTKVHDEIAKRTIVDSIINYAALTAQGTADGKIRTWFQTTPPVGLTDKNDGDIWFDQSDNNKSYRYEHPVWIPIDDKRILKAINYIILQGAIADGTIFVYFSTEAPTEANQSILIPPNPGPSEGDVWIDITQVNGQPKNDVYVYQNNEWVMIDDPELRSLLISFASAKAIADGAVTIYFSPVPPDDTFVPPPRYGDIWFDTSTVSIPNPDADDPLSEAYIDVTKWQQFRYDGENWIPIEDFRIKIIEANLKSETFARTAANTALAGEITEANTRIGENFSSIQQSLTSINGIAAQYGVRTNVNNKVIGFGFLTDYEREITFELQLGARPFQPADIIFIGNSWETATYSAVIVTVDNVNGKMRVISETGLYENAVLIRGKDRLESIGTTISSTMNPTPGISEFEIVIDRFKITDGITSYTPFRVENGVVYIGAVDTSVPQTNYIGEFASEPDANLYEINAIYKNTTSGNTFILKYITGNSGPKEWVPFLSSGSNARTLIVTSDNPGFLFDSNASSVPNNTSILINVQYMGQPNAVSSSMITVRNQSNTVITPPLLNQNLNNTQEPDATGTSNRGTFSFNLAYSDIDVSHFPITVTVDDGTIDDRITVYRIVGSTAKTISLNPDSFTFLFSNILATDPENDTIFFRIEHVALGSAPTVSEVTILDANGTTYIPSNFNSAPSGTGASSFNLSWSVIQNAPFPITVQVEDEGILDIVSIRKLVGGTDATTGFLTNEAHVIPTNEFGDLVGGSLDGAVGRFKVYQGITLKNDEVNFSVHATNNCSATIDNTSGATSGNYAITNMTSDNAWADFSAIVNTVTIIKRMSLAKSKAGQNSRVLRLLSNSQTFLFDGDNFAVDGNAAIVFSTLRTNVPPVTWTAIDQNNNPVSLTGSGTDERTLTIANFGASTRVRVTASVVSDGVTYSDTISIVRLLEGSDAVQVILSNENHTFYADENGIITEGDYVEGNSLVRVFRGSEEITYQAAAGPNKFRLGTLTASQGVTVNNSTVLPNVGISLLSGKFGFMDVPVIYQNSAGSNTTITKRITYSKSIEGQKGRTLQLFGTSQTFRFDGDGKPITPNDSITVEARKQNLGTVTFTALNELNQTVAITGSGDSRSISIADFGNSERVTITATATYQNVGVNTTVTDKFTIYRIVGVAANINVLLSNESHTFYADQDGIIPSSQFVNGNSSVRVFRGSEEITFDEISPFADNTFRFGAITTTGVTRNTFITGANVGINAMSTDFGIMTVPVIYTNPNSVEETFVRIISYAKAKTGAQARNLRLLSTSQIFRFNGVGQALDNSDNITLTAVNTLIGVNPTWTAIDNTGSNITLTGNDPLERTLTIGNFGSSEYVRVTISATININGIDSTFTDTLTIVRVQEGRNALTVIAENEAHTFSADENGIVSNYSEGDTGIVVFFGGEPIIYGTTGNNRFKFGTPTLTNATRNNSLVAPTLGINNMSADSGKMRIPVIYKDINGNETIVQKELSYSKSRRGIAARNIRLLTTRSVFEFTSTNVPFDNTDEIIFTGVTTNVSITSFTATNENDQPVTLTGTGNSRSLSIVDFGSSEWVKIRIEGTSTVQGNLETFSDETTILRLREGSPSVQVSLSNESHTFFSDEGNNVLSSEFPGGNSTITVYAGTEIIPYNVSGATNTWRLGVSVVANNVTRNTSLDLPIIGINAFTQAANTGSLTFDVIYTDRLNNQRTITRSKTFSKSKSGRDARTFRLIASSQTFSFQTLGEPVNSNDSITFNSIRQFITGATVWTAVNNSGVNVSLTAGANADEKILSVGDFGASEYVTVTATATDTTTGQVLTDKNRVVRLKQGSEGKDGISVSISNENHSFFADELGNVANYATGNFSITVTRGSTNIAYSATKVNNTFRVGTIVTLNTTRNTNLSAPTYGISNMSDDFGSLTLPVLYTDEDGQDITFTRVVTYTKSRAGTNVRNIRLISDGMTFSFDQFNQPIDTNETIVFTAFRTNLGSPTWTIVDQNNNPLDFTSGTGDTRNLNINSLGSATSAIITVSASHSGVTYTDRIRVVRLRRGDENVNIVISNESHTYFADEGGVIEASDYAGGDAIFQVFKGLNSIDYASVPANNKWWFHSVTPTAGLTVSQVGATVSVTNMTSNSGTVAVIIRYRDLDGVNHDYTKTLSYTKAKNGRDARWVRLTSTEQVFGFNSDNLPIDNTQSVVFTIGTNLVDIANVVVTAENQSQANLVLTGTGNTRTLTISNFGASDYAVVKAVASITVQGQAQIVTDQITIGRVRDGSGVVQALLSNEAHTFAADENGIISNFAGGNSVISVFRGSEEIVYASIPTDNSWRIGTISTVNVTRNTGLTLPTVGINAMSSEFGTMTIPIIYRNPVGVDTTINKVISFSRSRAGSNARLMRLFSTGNIFQLNEDGNLLADTPNSYTVTAISTNLGTPTFTAFNEAGASINVLSNGINDFEKVLNYSSFGNNKIIRVVASGVHNSITYEDQITFYKIKEGSSNVVVVLSNESHTFGANEDGVIADYLSGDNLVKVFRGTEEIAFNSVGDANTFNVNTFVATNVTRKTSGITLPNVGINAMSEDTGSLTFNVVYTDSNQTSLSPITKTISYAKARSGVNARNIRLLTSGQQFNFNGANQALDANDIITFQAVKAFLPETTVFTAVNNLGTNITLTGTGNNRTLSITNFGTSLYVDVTATVTSIVGGTSTVYQDTVRVVRVRDGVEGAGGIVAIASNESHTFFAETDGSISNYGGGGSTFSVFRGLEQILYNSTAQNNRWRFGTPVVNGITVTLVTSGANAGSLTVSSMTQDSATATIPIIYRSPTGQDTTINKTLSYARAIRGFTGVNGLSIFQTNPSHTFSTDASGTLLPGVNFADGNSTFSVFLGATPMTYTTSITPTIGQYRITNVAAFGVTRNTGLALPIVGINAMSADVGYLEVTLVPKIDDNVNQPTIIQRVNYSKSRAGATGANAVQFYIKPNNGTAIRNGIGSLTGVLVRVDGSSETIMNSGTVKLYRNGVDLGYSYSLNSANITGSTVIEARNGGSSGPILDTITLLDIKDGLGGGFVETSRGLVLQRLSAASNTIDPASTIMTGTFYETGTTSNPVSKSLTIAGRVSGGSLQLRFTTVSGSAAITTEIKRADGNIALLDTWYTTSSLNINFIYNDPTSGIQNRVSETVYIVAPGATGATGSQGITGIRGSRTVFASGTSWNNTTATNAIIAATGTNPIVADVVTISSSAAGFAETRTWDGSTWISVVQVINGNAVVQGTLAADRIATGLIETANISIGNNNLILSGVNRNLKVSSAGIDRVIIGDVGGGNYGITIRDASNNVILSSTGVPTSALQGEINYNTLNNLPTWITDNRVPNNINASGQLDFSKIIGTTKPANNANVARVYRQASAPGGTAYTTNDTWYNTTNSRTYRWSGSAWNQEIGNNFVNTNQLVDGAELGKKAQFRIRSNGTLEEFGFWSELNSAISSGNISTYIASAAIGSAYIASVRAESIETGTLAVNIALGVGTGVNAINLNGTNGTIVVGGNITIGNGRILVSD